MAEIGRDLVESPFGPLHYNVSIKKLCLDFWCCLLGEFRVCKNKWKFHQSYSKDEDSGDISLLFTYIVIGLNWREPFINESAETCTTFSSESVAIPRHTQFRIEVADDINDYAEVTMIGTNLGCGHNLYVSPLSRSETEKWTGHWTTCPFKGSVDVRRRRDLFI
ncbi:hypothetical protein LSH36_75g02044 [Paralvinella palmiformis]|uniref:Uncharacterized protein n=1 Tax=Paralvinella palmiformis TaxID=53620 RepID=A0AAD9K2F3_9ANNE|nr:hypothetical protein LSH36_75g02044 [Paralvinella palmiformis]